MMIFRFDDPVPLIGQRKTRYNVALFVNNHIAVLSTAGFCFFCKFLRNRIDAMIPNNSNVI